MRIGVYSKTNVCILYIEGIVKPALVEEAHQRLRKISIDAVNDINKLRELISDAPYTLFPTTEETERPDRVVAGLLQGRIGFMLDGAPTCLKVPTQFIHFLTSAEDYYMHFTLTLFIRVLRHVAYWASLLLPSLYVALLSYNQDLMPTPLLVTVASQHRGIPFPTILEALGMMGAFEVLREAGTRLPQGGGAICEYCGYAHCRRCGSACGSRVSRHGYCGGWDRGCFVCSASVWICEFESDYSVSVCRHSWHCGTGRHRRLRINHCDASRFAPFIRRSLHGADCALYLAGYQGFIFPSTLVCQHKTSRAV